MTVGAKRFPSKAKLLKLASLLSITDQKSGRLVPFELNDEQMLIIDAVAGKTVPKIQTLKARQIGSSTVFCFLDAVYMVINPGCAVGLVADEEVKAQALVERVKDFLHQMGLPTPTGGRNYVKLANGSSIRAVTANAQKGQEMTRTGRSYSFQLLHLTELAFWPDQNAYGGLEASAGLACPIWNESTSSGPGDLFWHQWVSENSFTKLFFPMQMHKAYRKDRALNFVEEQEALKLGFSSDLDGQMAAAFFFDKMSESFRGDLVRALREYPQMPSHAFMSAEGRWIRMSPQLTPKVDWKGFEIYIAPEECAGGVVIAVDTSEGKDLDGSAIAVVDRATGSLAACYKSLVDEVDDLAMQVREIYHKYGEKRVHTVFIEDNSIGHATVQKVRKLDVPVRAERTTSALQYTYMLNARRAIEKHQIHGGDDLIDECNSCRYNDKGKFEGKKDLLMSIGMALEVLRRAPYVHPSAKESNDTFDLSKYINGRGGKWTTFE